MTLPTKMRGQGVEVETVGDILGGDAQAAAQAKSILPGPGAYDDVSIEDYHGNPNLLPAPSISASGMKVILNQSPYHFWANSPMNPEPDEREDKPHLNIGKAAHDMLLLSDRWPEFYHVLPKGFARNATKKYADAIADEAEAREAGKTILRYQDAVVVERVSAAIGIHELAGKALSAGVAEQTLIAKDSDTGVFVRARPDWLPESVIHGGDIRVISDLKFMAPAHCHPNGFQKAIWNFGYHISAANYFDVIEQVYGLRPTHYLHIVVEKEFPFTVSLYPLPEQDIMRGAQQCRIATSRFADCLASGKWPGYADDLAQVGLPGFARKLIDEHGNANDAALINAD